VFVPFFILRKLKKAKEQEEGVKAELRAMERSVLWIGERENNHYEKTPPVKNPHMKIAFVVLSRK